MSYAGDGTWTVTFTVEPGTPVGDYFTTAGAAGVVSNETTIVTVTNAVPEVVRCVAPEEIYRSETLTISADLEDLDNRAGELKAFFLAWEQGKTPFLDPPTINITLSYQASITDVEHIFVGSTILPVDLPTGIYNCTVVVWDKDMAGYPVEYSYGPFMTMKVMNKLPGFVEVDVSGLSLVKGDMVATEDTVITVSGRVSDVEDGYRLSMNIVVTGPVVKLVRSAYTSALDGSFTFSFSMKPTDPSGNYTIWIIIRDKDGGEAEWALWFALNRPANVTMVKATPRKVYRVTETIVISADVVNDLSWETPDKITVYVNIRDPAGTWVNDTYTMAWNSTYKCFVWEHTFPATAMLGDYVFVVKVIDLYGAVSYSSPGTFTVLNNPPSIYDVSVEPEEVYRGNSTTLTFKAEDAEGIKTISVSLTYPNGTTVSLSPSHVSGSTYKVTVTLKPTDPLGNYTFNVTVVDTDNAATSAQAIFKGLNNPPVVVELWLEKLELKVGETIKGYVVAKDVEGLEEVLVCFYGPDGAWRNFTTTYSGGKYVFEVSTSGWPEGDYTVYAVAVDTDMAEAVYKLAEKLRLVAPPPPMPAWIWYAAAGAAAAAVGAAIAYYLKVVRPRRLPPIPRYR